MIMQHDDDDDGGKNSNYFVVVAGMSIDPPTGIGLELVLRAREHENAVLLSRLLEERHSSNSIRGQRHHGATLAAAAAPY